MMIFVTVVVMRSKLVMNFILYVVVVFAVVVAVVSIPGPAKMIPFIARNVHIRETLSTRVRFHSGGVANGIGCFSLTENK